MKLARLVLFSWILFGLLTACETEPPGIVDRPKPEVITLQVTPAVEHWLPYVAGCAQDIPDFGIYTQVLPRSELSLEESDLILRLGERMEDDPFVAVMGIEEIVVVAGRDVPVSSLSLDSLQALYSGEIKRWVEVSGVGTAPGTEEEPVYLLAYPPGHEIEILFSRAFLNNAFTLAAPQTYSTVAFLGKLLEMYPTGIGYLLKSQVPDGMRILQITDDQPVPSGQLVLAITSKAPEGRLRALLTCLQGVQ